MRDMVKPMGKDACSGILKTLEKAVLSANQFPSGDEFQVLGMTCPHLRKSAQDLKKRLVACIKSVAVRYGVNYRTTESDSASSDSTISLTPRDALYEETFEASEEALESFNSALDVVRGIQDAIVQPTGGLGPSLAPLKVGLGYLGKRQGGHLDIEKPQLLFPDHPVDNSDAPFVSPYSQPETGAAPETDESDGNSEKHVDRYMQDLFLNNSKHGAERRHPYADEIESATAEMTRRKFRKDSVTIYRPLDTTPCALVETEEELFNVAERLRRVSEIAVDLENHSIRSFQGFTCLFQISTRREDFVIDTLKLRSSINRALAPIFADETIVKVFHGADKDVQWLERDFGMYVVNMFDTGQAARLLKMPSAALSYLLAKYCDVANTSKKKFQLADWRQRPLPSEMFEYARSDTHYLLYVYDRLRDELSEKALIAEAWERSAKVAVRRHSKLRYDPSMAGQLAAKHGLRFDRHQIRILEALCKWRDVTARREDESLPYVAPLHTMFGIVRARDNARTVPGLFKHGFPNRKIPPMMFKESAEIARIVADALDAKLDDAAIQDLPLSISVNKEEDSIRKEQGSKAKSEHGNVDHVAVAGDFSEVNVARRAALEGSQFENEEPKKPSLPATSVRRLAKCTFFSSDSDVGTDEEEEQEQDEAEPNEEQSRKIETVETRNENEEMGKGRVVQGEETAANTSSKRASMFYSSDSSDEDEPGASVNRGMQRAAEVEELLHTELSKQSEAMKPEDFETEMVMRTRELQRIEELKAMTQTVEEKPEETKITSILESYGRVNREQKKRTRKERKTKEEAAQTNGNVVSPRKPFDYSNVTRELTAKFARKRKAKGFDPMEGLRDQRHASGRSDAKRRRRGRGRAMSFGSRRGGL